MEQNQSSNDEEELRVNSQSDENLASEEEGEEIEEVEEREIEEKEEDKAQESDSGEDEDIQADKRSYDFKAHEGKFNEEIRYQQSRKKRLD